MRTCLVLTILLAVQGTGIAADSDSQPAYSPDGRQVTYIERDDHDDTLQIRDTITGEVKRLIAPRGRKLFPQFSPDGHFIAFQIEFQDSRILTVTDITGHGWPVATIRGVAESAAWSPNAEYLFYSGLSEQGDFDIFRVTSGGTHLINLTQSPDRDERLPKPSSDGGTVHFMARSRAPGESIPGEVSTGLDWRLAFNGVTIGFPGE